jgi:hypothetical protein
MKLLLFLASIYLQQNPIAIQLSFTNFLNLNPILSFFILLGKIGLFKIANAYFDPV